MRLDQWLWAVRLYRTRTVAVAAIKNGWVTQDGQETKPSKDVQPGQRISARTGDITRTYEVVGYPASRVSAALVPSYAIDHTPPEEYQRPRQPAPDGVAVRARGTGRPTKRDRRQLDRFQDDG